MSDNNALITERIELVMEKGNLNRIKHATGLADTEDACHYALMKYCEQVEKEQGAPLPDTPVAAEIELTE